MCSPMPDIDFDRDDGICWCCGAEPVGAGLVDMCRHCVDGLAIGADADVGPDMFP